MKNMNLPNKLTLLRVCMIPVFVVLAYQQKLGFQLAAAAVFLIASFTDMLDGKIARRNNLVTNFGKFADPIADKLLVMSAMVMLTAQGRMPAWVCICLLGREFIISGFRLVAVDAGNVIAAGWLGKVKTVFQMTAVTMLLVLTPVTGEPLLGAFMETLAHVVMYISLALTIVSGAQYIIQNFDCIKDM